MHPDHGYRLSIQIGNTTDNCRIITEITVSVQFHESVSYTHLYMNGNFNTCMGKLKMKHLPHDGRHTFASLMDSAGANDVCIKLIMGQSMKNDSTKGTYTHKTFEEILAEVNTI